MTAQTLLNDLRTYLIPYPKGRVFDGFRLSDYLGTPREVYKIPTPEVRSISRKFLKSHPDLSNQQMVALLSSLYRGETYTERQIASNLLGIHHSFRRALDPLMIKVWLETLTGWCEIDNLCQSNFSAEEMLANWPAWQKLFSDLVGSKHVSQRRASLVLLTRAVRETDDERLAETAFVNIERLETAREILITKAISWLLRELITQHRDRVARYLENHQETLPKIAFREVRRKLTTGKK